MKYTVGSSIYLVDISPPRAGTSIITSTTSTASKSGTGGHKFQTAFVTQDQFDPDTLNFSEFSDYSKIDIKKNMPDKYYLVLKQVSGDTIEISVDVIKTPETATSEIKPTKGIISKLMSTVSEYGSEKGISPTVMILAALVIILVLYFIFRKNKSSPQVGNNVGNLGLSDSE
jgi:hypothetical protein